MAYDPYLDDIKKLESKINDLNMMHINAQQIEEYTLADDIKSRINELENELDKLKSFR